MSTALLDNPVSFSPSHGPAIFVRPKVISIKPQQGTCTAATSDLPLRPEMSASVCPSHDSRHQLAPALANLVLPPKTELLLDGEIKGKGFDCWGY